MTHEHYISRESRDHLSDQTLSREQFRLIHYAGEVSRPCDLSHNILEKKKTQTKDVLTYVFNELTDDGVVKIFHWLPLNTL